jgi:TM2 domain-containing membrane protein YozV/ribosomal protein L40E
VYRLAQVNQTEKSMKYCINCGAQIDARAEICPKCGVRVAPPPTAPSMPQQPYGYTQPQQVPYVEKKNEGLAAILSFLFIGLGQIYNGQVGKGILMLVVGVVFAMLVFVLIGIPLYLILWVYGIYDAYNTAKQINAGTFRP